MKITFLGTGTSQGVPVITCQCSVCCSDDHRDQRLRTSALIETEGKTIVIDTGPDFRQQMLRAGVQDIHSILITHHHKDHIAGLDDVRAYNFRHRRPMNVYATRASIDKLKREFGYVFQDEKYPGVPEITLHEIGTIPFDADGVAVEPIPVLHHRMPVLGFRIGDIAYITDANHIPEQSIEKLKGLEVLVLNALRNEPHISHFTLPQAIALAERIGASRTYFTHISHLLGTHAKVNSGLPAGMHLAYDGLTVEIDNS